MFGQGALRCNASTLPRGMGHLDKLPFYFQRLSPGVLEPLHIEKTRVLKRGVSKLNEKSMVRKYMVVWWGVRESAFSLENAKP